MRLGLDIGGTKIDGIAVGDDGTIVAHANSASGFGAEQVVANAVSVAKRLLGDSGSDGVSLGVGIPGVVDPEHGIVSHAVNLGLAKLQLADELSNLLTMPVSIENDVNASALGAYAALALNGAIAYLNLGTGLAAGFVNDGRLWRGSHGTAGEIGHIPLQPDGLPCPCGQRGCLETIASGSGIARQRHTSHPIAALDLFDHADAGVPEAVRIRDNLITGVITGIRLLVLTVDVDHVIIGGGISKLGDRLLDRILKQLHDLEQESPFLASLELDQRVRLIPVDQPIAALGAAYVAP